ncbi:unnamed protein product [Paramecium primaurelia]|uniref:Protein kinase domain-containing protein n=1 Tax=Paramecium primaurelia TaxID=5886 RepID=A0A8S1K9E3_PARPR|nr:unnamed protein product [Paramecium primaurelia]
MDNEIYEANFRNKVKYRKENGKKFINEYELLDELGQGSFGKVKRVTRYFKETEEQEELSKSDYAMKIFHKTVLAHQRTCFYESNSNDPKMTNLLEFADNEINIHKYLNHPNICKLYEIIDDEDDPQQKIYLIMQLGDLGCIMNFCEITFKYIRNQAILDYLKMNYIQAAKLLFKQIAQAIQYLHENNIVNRDIKIDNIICTTLYPLDQCCKLIDFSTSRIADKDSIFYDCAGTPGFRAPEVQFCLNDGYSPFKLDVWSFGICLYIYIHEKLPFWGEGDLETDLLARDQPLQFEIQDDLLINLINSCCAKKPQDRPTIQEILDHEWFK